MCSCHSILECCVTFSGVKLSIRSFVLFHAALLFCGQSLVPCVLESLSCEHILVQSFFYGTIFAGMATSTIQKYSSKYSSTKLKLF